MRKAVAEGCVFILVYLFAGATIGSTSANAGFSLAGAAFAAVSFFIVRAASRRIGERAAPPDCAADAAGGVLAPLEAEVLFAALALAALTSYAHSPEFFFSGWTIPDAGIRATLFHARMVRYLLLLLPFAAVPFLLSRRRRWLVPSLALLFAAAEILAATSLLRLAGEGTIYGDDHPSFLFRIMEFWGSFPWRENFVPHWNAGVVNSVLTSSGVPGYALLTAPLHLAFGKPHLYHALGLAAIHAFLMPWLAVVGLLSALALSAGHTLRPNVQLYRMAVPLALALAVPAAIRAGEALGDANPRSVPLQGAIALLLAFCAANTVGIYGGKGFAPAEGMAPAIRELAAWISENVPEDGRVAFLGPTGHAYGHAHVAYLPILAGREMMACDYYEFPPSTYERDFPPRVARRGPGGIRGYLARHGVSHAVTTRSNYISFMESRPDEFEQVARFSYSHWTGDSDIRVFEVKGGREGMLRGADGSVKATFNRIDVEFRGEPPERAVVAYRWNPRMRASPPAEIAPAPPAAPGEDPFIEIRPHGAEKARIDYVPRL